MEITWYSSLSQLARQSHLMQTELPTILNVLDTDYELEYSESYTGTVVFTKEMCADVISIDNNTLAQKFLFLENFAVAYDTDTLFVSDI